MNATTTEEKAPPIQVTNIGLGNGFFAIETEDNIYYAYFCENGKNICAFLDQKWCAPTLNQIRQLVPIIAEAVEKNWDNRDDLKDAVARFGRYVERQSAPSIESYNWFWDSPQLK